jgi:hypothetical protein
LETKPWNYEQQHSARMSHPMEQKARNYFSKINNKDIKFASFEEP